MAGEIDDIDRGILHLLQEDARNNTAPAIAERVDVTANTVRNRIERLENVGVIRGYYPRIDYERAGYQLRVVLLCTVQVADREAYADEALDLDGVVRIVECLSGGENLAIEAVARNNDDLTRITREVEDMGLTISDEWFVKDEGVRPFDNFGTDAVETTDD